VGSRPPEFRLRFPKTLAHCPSLAGQRWSPPTEHAPWPACTRNRLSLPTPPPVVWGRFRDEHDREKRVPLATDKKAAETLLSELVRKVERMRAGLEDPFERHQKRPLSGHVLDFQKYLQARERTPRYIGDEAEKKKREKSSFLASRDDHGRVVDFHSLRNTFITNLSLSGVQPKAAQTLARHSDINLTMNTYTMLRVLDQAAAVEALPPVPEAKGRKGSKRRKNATTSPAVSGATEPNASEDVSRILAAWAQIPADVRERLLASGRTPQGTVVG